MVTFPAEEHHFSLASTKLCCLTEAHGGHWKTCLRLLCSSARQAVKLMTSWLPPCHPHHGPVSAISGVIHI